MKKLLATGLIASVAFATAESSASCGNGGFYVQGSFGLSTTKMKYKNNLDPQYNVLALEEFQKMRIEVAETNGGLFGDYVCRMEDLPMAKTNAIKTSFNKRQSLFQGELGFGYYKEFGSEFVLGLSLNIGKNFGTVKKKEMGVALKPNYNHFISVESGRLADIQPNQPERFRNPPHQAATEPYPDDQFHFDDNLIVYWVGDLVSGNKKDNFYQRDLEIELKCKNKYYVSIMPRFGILVNPKLELFVAAGVKIKSDKYTMYVPSLKKSAKKTVTKCIPVVQVGLQYNFHNGMFANLSYTFNFKAKKTFKFKANNQINMDSTVKHTLQNSSHDIKLGFGYRF